MNMVDLILNINNFRTGKLVRRKEVVEMKYSDVLKEAQSLVSETIVDYRPAYGLYIDVMEFGKTVFLTKSEAEAKLKELRGGENER